MCGFSGIISDNSVDSELIVKSVTSIKHRGPDDTLIFTGESSFHSCAISNATTQQKYPSVSNIVSPFFFGFNRLSIVDLSEHGMQPFCDSERQISFMLNGEIYNYVELRTQFLSEELFISDTDSEVAFRLYLKLGDEFVHHLRGMFSIVLYDAKSKRLKAWRDRLGMKPFYYAFVDDVFIFSSEMKGIFATGLVAKETNYQGLAYSMYLTTCPAPLTIFKNIHSLQAAHTLEFSLSEKKIITKSYWHLTYSPSKREIQFSEFDADLKEICRLHQTGDVEKAMMLSGGMDSGTLAYYFSQFDPKMKCLNIFAESHSTDEREYAAENARNVGLKIHFLEIPSHPSSEVLEQFLTAEEEPNSSPEAALFLSEKAKEMGIKVLYNALGPDEIFGGYSYFRTVAKIQKYQSFFSFVPVFLLPKKYQSKFRELNRFGVESFPMLSRRLFSWEEIRGFLKEKGEEIPIHPIEYIQSQVLHQFAEFRELPLLKRVSYLEIFYYISSHHTFRSDQPSMKQSIEMRFPFLDHLFIEKYFNQADIFHDLNLHLKPVFRKYVQQILPEKIFEMGKKGFSMPIEEWLKNKDLSILDSQKTWYQKMKNRVFS
ncbi:MAG: asparagine synthase (glutamine-hydrolyzing) [Bacteroidales bacterium]|nr:asparagine synthase (glutamine-hydrolyzing) [Bacteroidales bacterium]